MKNSSLFISILCFAVFLRTHAQENLQTKKIILDTIYANEYNNVALFFPETIRQGITGAPNFVFTYNREKEQYFGLLQATPGTESNLLVIGSDGAVFSYILKYRKSLDKLNYFFTDDAMIANEKPGERSAKISKEEINNENATQEHFKTTCKRLLLINQNIRKIKKRQNDIIFSIKTIVFDRKELYFVMEIENRSSLDYDFGFLSIATQSRKKGKRKSAQTLIKEPLFTYAVPSKIGKNEKRSFVYVIPKFSLNNDYRVIASLHEKQGVRDINLNLSHRFINHPN